VRIHGSGRLAGAGAGIVLVAAVLAACEPDPVRSTLDRPVSPVVLDGADLPALAGAPVGDVVAFRASSAGWTQIPVQVDERLATTVADVYDLPPDQFNSSTAIPISAYADPTTFAGADPDPALDADDEVVFMARDAGGRAPGSTPAGTVPGTGVEVRLDDPAVPGATGYVYLFRSSTLDPSAGASYVDYDFSLASGDYRTTYNRTAGPNPEDSTITGSTYTAHFADRWLLDEVTLTHGDRSGVDIVDRMKYRLIPGQCGRTEDTFDAGEGAFVVNKVGPVRGLRSYVGANSGPNTQATHAFYGTSIETTVDLRVHAIPGVASYLDLDRDAFGMTFRSPQAAGRVQVDGQPDAVATGVPSWWTFLGPQGGLGVSASVDTDLPLTPATRYEDDVTPATTQCTGDGEAVGEAGATIGAVDCTDPGLTGDCGHHLRSRTVMVAAVSIATPAELQHWAEQAGQPLTATTSAWTP